MHSCAFGLCSLSIGILYADWGQGVLTQDYIAISRHLQCLGSSHSREDSVHAEYNNTHHCGLCMQPDDLQLSPVSFLSSNIAMRCQKHSLLYLDTEMQQPYSSSGLLHTALYDPEQQPQL